MSLSIVPGDKIPLIAHLECPPGTIFYVQAEILKPDRNPITGSPVQLSDEGGGRFFDGSLDMPDEAYLSATYRIYTNPGLTEESTDYCPVTITITRDKATAGEPIGIKRNGFTEIKVDTSSNVNIGTGSNNTNLDVKAKNNVIIMVSDDDTEISSDDNGVNIGVN